MHDDIVGGRYRLEEQIGNGGMAEVWRATDSRTGETVAVKRLHPRLAARSDGARPVPREIEAARAVDHPAAVRVLDAGDGDDAPMAGMEHLAGGSLSDRLRAGPSVLAGGRARSARTSPARSRRSTRPGSSTGT